jgi:Na+/H+-dicarboxylate symporter
MPMTLVATEKNINDQSGYADFVIPATVNNHMTADGLNISLTALFLVCMIGHPFPQFIDYLPFVLYYSVAKFSCAAIPGGGVLVILPVVQNYLNVPAEMTALLATLYILQDPIMTSGNVMANGAFAILTHRFLRKFKVISSV